MVHLRDIIIIEYKPNLINSDEFEKSNSIAYIFIKMSYFNIKQVLCACMFKY